MSNKKEFIRLNEVGDTVINDLFLNRYVGMVSDKMIPYQWKMINDDQKSGIVHDFRVAAGEIEGEHIGMVFQDEGLFKWIESAAYSLAQKPDSEMEEWVDYVIDLAEKAQQKDGYLFTYFMLKCPEMELQNLLESHELVCLGNILEAGIAYYHATGKRKLLDVAIRLSDFLCTHFLDEEENRMLVPGHPGIELCLVKMYRETGNRRYLELARHFLDVRGQDPDVLNRQHEQKWNRSNIFPEWNTWADHKYMQIHQPVREQKTVEGHGVRANYLYAGMVDVYMETGDESLLEACKTLYRNMVGKRMYITGGIGSACCGERFTADYDLPNDTVYAESCASVALALFGRRMFQATGDGKYMDTVEQALYNTVFGSVSLDGEHYFYVNPLEVWPEASENNPTRRHVKATRQGWYQVACCPQNTLRTLAAFGQYMFMTEKDAVYCCLYASCDTVQHLENGDVKLHVETRYPFENTVKIRIDSNQTFRLFLRDPGWSEKTKVLLNGQQLDVQTEDGMIQIDRSWKEGDCVELVLDMKAEIMISHPRIRANAGKIALKKGPLVYCLEEADNGENLGALYVSKDAEIGEVFDPELFGGTLCLEIPGTRITENDWQDDVLYRPYRKSKKEVLLKAIPYCLWNNRGQGEMIVWVNCEK